MSRVDALIDGRVTMLARGSLMLGSDVAVDDDELRAILDHPKVPPLTMIDVFAGRLGPAGVRALAASDKVRGLDDLRLGSCPIGDDGLAILAAALPALTRLAAPNVGATARGAEAVAAGRWRLVRVELGHQAIGDDGARALAGLALDHLLVQDAGIGGAGARRVIADGQVVNLTLDGNPIGAGGLVGVERISSATRTLFLAKAGLADADLEALATASAPALRALSLRYHAGGDAGLAALARAPWLAQLEALDVTGSRRGGGLTALAAAWGARPGLTPSS
jgi:hypothetical protein